MADLAKKGIGIIAITHDLEEALISDRIVALDRGRIAADMPPARFFSDEAVMSRIGVRPPYTYELAKYAGRIPLEVTRECR
jgi:ABC-type sugar transport system ATPase subunit